jgi:hypothetical protein
VRGTGCRSPQGEEGVGAKAGVVKKAEADRESDRAALMSGIPYDAQESRAHLLLRSMLGSQLEQILQRPHTLLPVLSDLVDQYP